MLVLVVVLRHQLPFAAAREDLLFLSEWSRSARRLEMKEARLFSGQDINAVK